MLSITNTVSQTACNICFKKIGMSVRVLRDHITEMRKAMGSSLVSNRYPPGVCDNSKVILSSAATKNGTYLDDDGNIPYSIKESVVRRNKDEYFSNPIWKQTYNDIMKCSGNEAEIVSEKDDETFSSETESEYDESISEEVIDEIPKVQDIPTPPSPQKRSISLLIGEGMANPIVTLKKQKTGTMMTISF